mmetsp:Transcript_3152/g.5861  ORF Transcript_3152/g.5861 Transcript_3152/m.5861 type:complete len:143 (+) Transcript_3152:134-562(+)
MSQNKLCYNYLIAAIIWFMHCSTTVRGLSSTSSPSLIQNTNGNGVGGMSRLSFLKTACGVATATTFVSTIFPSSCLAKEVDPSLKGTKADPKYQACLSECIYECTKPKTETKTRAECLTECKAKCATTKEQMMVGSPKAKTD